MSPLFCAFLALLGVHAVAAPWIGAGERFTALGGLLILLWWTRAWPAVLCGVLLGLFGVGQLALERRAADTWMGREVVASLRVCDTRDASFARVEVGAAGLPSVRMELWAGRYAESLRESGGGLGRLVVDPLPHRRNPDDRDPRRVALARGALLRGRLVDFAPNAGSTFPSPRRRIAEALEERLGGSSGLWRALLLGDRRGLDVRVRERMRDLGLAHLLALSGMHVGGMLALLALPNRGRIPAWALLPLGLWILLAGAGASLLRAGAMASWWIFARRCQRRVIGQDALAFAGFLDLCSNPARSGDVGWWLSYAATYALIRCAGRLSRRRLLSALQLSAAAAAATTPWALAVFGQWVWFSPLSNLLAAPLFALLMATGTVLVLVGAACPFARAGTDLWIQLISHGFGAWISLLDRLFPDPLGHPGIHGNWWAAALALFALGFLPRPSGRTRAIAIVVALIAVHLPLTRQQQTRWWSLDVGQGDAGVLRNGSSWLLVDSGPERPGGSAAASVVLPFLRRRNARDVGYAITHGHLDHMGGARLLIESGRVGALFVAASDSAEAWVLPLRRLCALGNVDLRALSRGDTLRHGRLEAEVLWPPRVGAPAHANDRSLVLLAGAPGEGLLLAGDLEREGERALLEGALPRVRALKLAHHGGDTGSDVAWLERLDPRWVIISCGRENRYGHPHPRVLERLRRRGIATGRTDEAGWLEIRWEDGRMRPRGGWP